MRTPFGYESNAYLIRQLLVPDHIGEAEWSTIEHGWRRGERTRTLLEHLATEWRDQNVLLEILSESLDVDVCNDPVKMDQGKLDALGAMMQSHGFMVLGNRASKRLLAGGETMNPDLGKYLGEAAADWQWVLVPPLRHGNPPALVLQEDPPPAAAGDLAAWLKNLLQGLWSSGATDIHFEIEEETLRVRAHEAGRMRTVGNWQDGRSTAVLRLVCRWAGLSDWDQRSFVDGTLLPPGTCSSSRLRFSIIPTVTGSSIVLRAPAPSLYARNLKELGLSQEFIHLIMDKVYHEKGLILCTGSTGSGKTTTLYGILKELERDNFKILTIEDPVEQEIPHAVQSSVDLRNGWTFDRAVHAFLRQDPDIIMIGEIRDAASAAAACRAALTGHCVLSTMHASSTDAALERLAAWDLPQGILAESINLVINQQLFRKCSDNAATVKFRWNADLEEAVSCRL